MKRLSQIENDKSRGTIGKEVFGRARQVNWSLANTDLGAIEL